MHAILVPADVCQSALSSDTSSTTTSRRLPVICGMRRRTSHAAHMQKRTLSAGQPDEVEEGKESADEEESAGDDLRITAPIW